MEIIGGKIFPKVGGNNSLHLSKYLSFLKEYRQYSYAVGEQLFA
jgi:hypothetical protein